MSDMFDTLTMNASESPGHLLGNDKRDAELPYRYVNFYQNRQEQNWQKGFISYSSEYGIKKSSSMQYMHQEIGKPLRREDNLYRLK